MATPFHGDIPMPPAAVPLVTVLLALVVGVLGARSASLPSTQTPAPPALSHRFERITDTIYSAVTTIGGITESNSAVIINPDDVLIVDSHVTPWTARRLVDDITTLTSKPVRWVINSHYHFDHAHGNQIFLGQAAIVGHEYTRMRLLTNVLEQLTARSFTSGVPARIDTLKQQMAAETDARRRAELEAQLSIQQQYGASLQEIRPTPPQVTVQDEMSLFFGAREVRLLFLGRGHTGGDLIVYRPAERVLATGDFLVGPPRLSYMGDAYVADWIDSLEKLKTLPFDTAIPGHGPVVRDPRAIDQFQAYLRDLLRQVTALKAQGLSKEEAATRVDMTSHKEAYPNIAGPGVDVRAVDRMYDLLDGRDPIR
jgi:glyoxylase-like metal-dependent hydrolase (beta-lactamase superfamily II)